VIETAFGLDFPSRFEREMSAMRELERDGLVIVRPDGGVDLTFPLGRVLMRNVAAAFDAYLDPDA
jgi:coproporphyrinogen III oxidase-like Fe-S oxidoreductase